MGLGYGGVRRRSDRHLGADILRSAARARRAGVARKRQRFRAIFQQAGIGVAQISLDGKVELANDRYCEVVGYPHKDLVGMGNREISQRADLREETEMLPRLLAGEIQSFSTAKRYKRQDGGVVWATMCRTLVRDREEGRRNLSLSSRTSPSASRQKPA